MAVSSNPSMSEVQAEMGSDSSSSLRVMLNRAFGSEIGSLRDFAGYTHEEPPSVDTLATSDWIFEGDLVNTGGLTCNRYIQYRRQGNTGWIELSAGSTSSTGVFSADAGPLLAGVTYEYRAKATNSEGTDYGFILTYTP